MFTKINVYSYKRAHRRASQGIPKGLFGSNMQHSQFTKNVLDTLEWPEFSMNHILDLDLFCFHCTSPIFVALRFCNYAKSHRGVYVTSNVCKHSQRRRKKIDEEAIGEMLVADNDS